MKSASETQRFIQWNSWLPDRNRKLLSFTSVWNKASNRQNCENIFQAVINLNMNIRFCCSPEKKLCYLFKMWSFTLRMKLLCISEEVKHQSGALAAPFPSLNLRRSWWRQITLTPEPLHPLDLLPVTVLWYYWENPSGGAPTHSRCWRRRWKVKINGPVDFIDHRTLTWNTTGFYVAAKTLISRKTPALFPSSAHSLVYLRRPLTASENESRLHTNTHIPPRTHFIFQRRDNRRCHQAPTRLYHGI